MNAIIKFFSKWGWIFFFFCSTSQEICTCLKLCSCLMMDIFTLIFQGYFNETWTVVTLPHCQRIYSEEYLSIYIYIYHMNAMKYLHVRNETKKHYTELFAHWGRMTHIRVGKLSIIGSDNGLSPGWRQAIIKTNAGILLIGPLGTNFSQISIGIQIFSFKKMRLKVSSVKRRPFCYGLNVLGSSSLYPLCVPHLAHEKFIGLARYHRLNKSDCPC